MQASPWLQPTSARTLTSWLAPAPSWTQALLTDTCLPAPQDTGPQDRPTSAYVECMYCTLLTPLLVSTGDMLDLASAQVSGDVNLLERFELAMAPEQLGSIS